MCDKKDYLDYLNIFTMEGKCFEIQRFPGVILPGKYTEDFRIFLAMHWVHFTRIKSSSEIWEQSLIDRDVGVGHTFMGYHSN